MSTIVRTSGVGTSGAALNQPFIDLATVFNLNLAGTADCAAAMQSAITSLATTGGEIVLRAGTYAWSSSTPLIPVNLPKTIRIRFMPGARVVLSSAAPAFLWFNKLADYDVCQNVTITGPGVIDCNNVAAAQQVVIGSYINGSYTTRISAQNILVEDLTTVNVPTDPAAASTPRINIAFVSKHLAANEATQTFLKNITVRRCSFNGGGVGVLIMGHLQGGTLGTSVANIYHDNILIEDCYHTTGAVQTTSFFNANFQVGQYSSGGRVTFRRLVGHGSGDDAFEINNTDHAVLEDCVAQESALAGFIITNFQPSPNQLSQDVYLTRCRVERKSLGATSATPGRGFRIDGSSNNSNLTPVNNVVMTDCSYFRSGSAYQDTAATDEALQVLGAVRRFRCDGFRVAITGYNIPTPTANFVGAVCALAPSGATTPLEFDIRDWRFYVNGSMTSGAAFFKQWAFVSFRPTNDGTEVILNAHGIFIEYAQANTGANGTARCFYIPSGKFRALVRRMVILSSTDAAIRGLFINAGAMDSTSRLRLDSCDTSKSNSLANEITTNQPTQIIITNHRWVTTPRAAASISVTASPFTYQNLDMVAQQVLIQGGTVSKIEYSVDGTTYTDIGITAGAVPVQPAEYLRVTYSSAPTMTRVYDRN